MMAGASGAMRARGWRATAIPFQQLRCGIARGLYPLVRGADDSDRRWGWHPRRWRVGVFFDPSRAYDAFQTGKTHEELHRAMMAGHLMPDAPPPLIGLPPGVSLGPDKMAIGWRSSHGSDVPPQVQLLARISAVRAPAVPPPASVSRRASKMNSCAHAPS
jgi:hypothetical protein